MTLKSFNIKQTSFSNNVDKSLTMWLDYNLFNQGGYYSRTSDNLSSINHPEESNCYGSNRKNWVWESGTIDVSVNSVPVTTGYSINYRDGLVIFDSNPGGSVKASYSYKSIQVINSKDNKFFRGANTGFDVYEGVYREDSIQMPTIVVKHARHNSNPSQLGGYFRHVNETKNLMVFHSNAELVERISDVLINQIDSYFGVFDFDKAHNSGFYPIGKDGTLINSSGVYPYLTENYKLHGLKNSSVYVTNTKKEDIQPLGNKVWYSTVGFDLTSEYNMGVT